MVVILNSLKWVCIKAYFTSGFSRSTLRLFYDGQLLGLLSHLTLEAGIFHQKLLFSRAFVL